MTKVKNISTGPRGAWLGTQLIMAEAGQTIDADDFAPEWFEASGGDKPEGKAPATADDIRAALALLDKDNDEHWTGAGLPAVDAVSELLSQKVTRAQIEEADAEFARPQGA